MQPWAYSKIYKGFTMEYYPETGIITLRTEFIIVTIPSLKVNVFENGGDGRIGLIGLADSHI